MNQAIKKISPRQRDWLTLIGVGCIVYGFFGAEFTTFLAILFVGGLLLEIRNHLIPKEEKEKEETDDRSTRSSDVL
jgi:hypothetical protein